MPKTLLALLLTFATQSVAAPSLTLLSKVGDKKPSSEWKYLRQGETLELSAALKGGKATGFRWFKLESTTGSVDNTQPSFHFADIAYRATELTDCRDKPSCTPDVSPLGVMAFSVEATLEDGRVVKTPGLDSKEYGGLSRKVHKIAVRKDDSYLGYVTELFNTPYIFGSAGPDGRNQSDLLIGSDCADLAVYGQRRLGKKLEYVSSYTIDQHAPEIARVTAHSAEGEAHDKSGKALRFGDKKGELKPGDVIHFPSSRHVGILWEDVAPKGVLDQNDLMVHTCWAPPKVEPIWASGCSSLPTRLLRFR